MKKLLLVLSLVTSLSVIAQTNPPPTLTDTNLVPPAASTFLSFLAGATNLMVAPYGIVGTEGKYGGGIALAYKLSDMIVPTIRMDYYDGRVWMPSADMQLQVPLLLGGKVTFIPFGFAGIATPLTGKGSDNFTPVAIIGAGGAVRIGAKWDLVGDIEKWSGFKGEQIRFGVLYKF